MSFKFMRQTEKLTVFQLMERWRSVICTSYDYCGEKVASCETNRHDDYYMSRRLCLRLQYQHHNEKIQRQPRSPTVVNMPELPEVENFRRLLLPLVSKKSKLSLECTSKTSPPKKFLSPDELNELNENCFVESVERKGKLLCMVLKCIKKIRNQTRRISTPDIIPTLKELKDTDEYPPPHCHLRLKTDTAEASFSDPRKFGYAVLSTTPGGGFDELAPDALHEIKQEQLNTGLIGKSMGIKGLLLDQKRVVSGVGNWVADEILYQCQLHPEQTHLSESQVDKLGERMKFILTTAVQCLDDNEEFPLDWLFHCRWGKRVSKSKTIQDPKGRLVTFLTAAGRTSAIVPSIQKKTAGKRPKKETSGKTKSEKNTSDYDMPSVKMKIEPPKRKANNSSSPSNGKRVKATTNKTVNKTKKGHTGTTKKTSISKRTSKGTRRSSRLASK